MLIRTGPCQANSHNFPYNLSLWIGGKKGGSESPSGLLQITCWRAQRNLKSLVNLYLLSTYYIMGTVVDTRGTALDKPHTVSLFMDQGRG